MSGKKSLGEKQNCREKWCVLVKLENSALCTVWQAVSLVNEGTTVTVIVAISVGHLLILTNAMTNVIPLAERRKKGPFNVVFLHFSKLFRYL